MKDDPGGLHSVVAAGRCSAPQVGAKPPHGVWLQVLLTEAAEEGCVVDGVKRFREIHRHCHCSMGGTLLVEAIDHLLSQWEESCGGGAVGAETMLGV